MRKPEPLACASRAECSTLVDATEAFCKRQPMRVQFTLRDSVLSAHLLFGKP